MSSKNAIKITAPTSIKAPQLKSKRRRRFRATCWYKRSRACISKTESMQKSKNAERVCEKLKALRNLIPEEEGKNTIKDCSGENVVKNSEKLFGETADYILYLRTQVVILHRLIHLYGSAGIEQRGEERHLEAVCL